MDEIEELKKALGRAAEGYDDGRFRHLSRELDLAAEFLIEVYALNSREESQTRNIRPELTDSACAVR